MLKTFLLFLILIHSLAAAATASELVLDLNKQIDVELLPYSQYHIDTSETASLENIKKKDNIDWLFFKKAQLNQGFISHPLWVKTTIKTSGDDERNIVLTLHQAIDQIELEISTDGEETQHFPLGKGNPPRAYHLKEQNNLNHAIINLKPNKTYHIIMGISSANPVVGGFRAVDIRTLELETQKQNQWVLAFLLIVFIISLYNFVIYLSTHNRAFLFHVCYVTSLTIYLLNDHGYLAHWFNVYDLNVLQKVTAVSLVSAYISMVIFFDTMNELNAESVVISRLNKILTFSGYLLLVLTFVIPYEYLIRLLSIQVLTAIVVGVFISLYRDRKFGERNQTHKRIVKIILVTFSPSVFLHIFNRIGLLEVKWYTDYILFFSIFVEVILISLVLFISVRKNKEAFRLELFCDNLSGLPNARALEEHFRATSNPTQQTLIQIWVSGLDKLEVVLGPSFYKQFISGITEQFQAQLMGNAQLIPLYDNRIGSFPMFHIDKNSFTLLCYPLDKHQSKTLEQQLTLSIDTLRHTHHNSIQLSVSVGAYHLDRNQTTFDNAIQCSLLALSYGIKNNQKFKYYNTQIGFDEKRRITLLNGFTDSLKNNEFFLLWQPQYDTKKPRITGVEVLARLQHPVYGTVSPDEFVPILEQARRISELSHWIITQVFEKLPALHKKHPEICVSINLSPRDLLEDGLIEFLEQQSKGYAKYIPYITLEITETVMIDDYSKVLSIIQQLQERGYNISIDDFGSGYASFSYLQKLPANELKIDKSYTDCYKEQTTYAILESIIQLAKRLDMSIVVEGVEHQQQIDLFTNMGAERLQGWGLDKPMSLESLMNKA